MAKVTLTIAGYAHELTCRDGEEPHFQRLAALVDEKAAQAARSVGGLTEIRMLLFAALLLADENGNLKAAAAALPEPAPPAIPDPVIAQAVAALATRIETLAEALETDAATA